MDLPCDATTVQRHGYGRPMTEFASGQRGLTAYEGLALRTGKPVAHIAELAGADRLSELFDSRGQLKGRPLTPIEALRRLDEKRYGPGQGPLSPAAAKIILRRWMSGWDDEVRERERRRRNPYLAIAELQRQRLNWTEDEC